MAIPKDQLFPGFTKPPTDTSLYVKERVGGDTRPARLDSSPWGEDHWEDDEYCYAAESGKQIGRRAGITTAPMYPPATIDTENFRVCPWCDGDGVSGWDEKERDIPCDHCEGGVIR